MSARRAPFVALASVALGVVVGFLLGGVGPRLDVGERDARIAELERRLEAAEPSGWRSPVPGLDRILRAPEQDSEAVDRPLPPAAAPSSETMDEATGDRAPTAVTVGDGGVPMARGRWREGWREDGPEQRLEAFRRAASLQRVRRLQSRAALVQQADLDEAEQAELDAALREMNESLYGYGEELIMLALSDEPPAARDLLGVTHDLTGVLHRAQVRVEGVLGPERLSEVDPSALEIWNHVDLAQLEPAAESAMRAAP